MFPIFEKTQRECWFVERDRNTKVITALILDPEFSRNDRFSVNQEVFSRVDCPGMIYMRMGMKGRIVAIRMPHEDTTKPENVLSVQFENFRFPLWMKPKELVTIL